MKEITVSFRRVYEEDLHNQHYYSVGVYEDQCDLEDDHEVEKQAFINLTEQLGEARTEDAKLDVIFS